jgi:hypothetical protein
VADDLGPGKDSGFQGKGRAAESIRISGLTFLSELYNPDPFINRFDR